MLKSMTAYASMEQTDNAISASVEIRSYNSRHLDMVLRLPPSYASFEEKIKKRVAATFMRGRVEVRIKIKDFSEAACAFEVDLPKAKAYLSAIRQLEKDLSLKSDSPMSYLLGLPSLMAPAECHDVQAQWPVVETCLQQTLGSVEQMRLAEGEYLGRDFVERLEFIEERLDQIAGATQGLLPLYRDKLRARIEALTKGLVELDPARIAQEAAMLADRSDISEEIVRARSHVQQFRDIMQADEPAGRKLNFLLQEFNREFNTMGSKMGQADAAHTIVEIKAEVEKLREQVQNIE